MIHIDYAFCFGLTPANSYLKHQHRILARLANQSFLLNSLFSLLIILMLTFANNAWAEPTFINAARPDLPTVAQGIPKGGALRVFGITLDQRGETDFELEQFEVFAENAQLVVNNDHQVSVPTDVYFRGSIVGEDGSIVVLAVPESGPVRGVITGTAGTWIISGTPGKSSQGLANRKVDVKSELANRTFECGNEHSSMDVARLLPNSNNITSNISQSLPANVTHTARIAVETDYEFYAKFGNVDDANRYIGDLFAYASTVYEAEVNTNLVVSWSRLWTTGDYDDPWTANTTSTALNQLQSYWSADADPALPDQRTLTHMLSGKSLGGGIAYVGVLCHSYYNNQTDYDFGVSASLAGNFDINNPNVVWDLLVVSHEIGHNFNSRHTQDYCGIGNNSDPVDLCYSSNNGCGSSLGLPGSGSLTGGTTLNKPGTIMSYCHLVSGGYANISFTLGKDHPYGIDAFRVPNVMKSEVTNMASNFPTCLVLDAPVNGSPPLAMEDFQTTLEDTAVIINVLSNDSDDDGDSLVITSFTQGSNGSVNGSSSLTYTPNLNFFGQDSFSYTISDGTGNFDNATVSVTVTGVNDEPVADDQLLSGFENTNISIALTGSDPEGDALSYSIITPPSNGSLSGTVPNLSYSPNTDYVGNDNFTFTVSDGNLTSTQASISLTIDEAPVPITISGMSPSVVQMGTNNEPVIISGTGFVSGISVTFSGENGPPPTFNNPVVINSMTISGLLTTKSGGSKRDRYWDINVANSDGSSDTQVDGLMVTTSTPANIPPVAENDSATTDENSIVIIDLLANDSDADGDALTITSVSQPSNGSVTDNGNGTVTYSPAADFTGTDAFTYTVSDNNGGNDNATVSVTVNSADGTPTADFSFTTNNLTANFTDLSTDSDGSIVSWLWDFTGNNSSTSTAQHPSHTYATAGTYTVSLTAKDNSDATDSISYSVTVSEPSAITLSVALQNRKRVKLTWSGATSTDVDVYQNGTLHVTTVNDNKESFSYNSGDVVTYKICQAGSTTICSNDAITVW